MNHEIPQDFGNLLETFRLSLTHNGASNAEAMLIIGEMASISSKQDVINNSRTNRKYLKEFQFYSDTFPVRYAQHLEIIHEFLAGAQALNEKAQK